MDCHLVQPERLSFVGKNESFISNRRHLTSLIYKMGLFRGPSYTPWVFYFHYRNDIVLTMLSQLLVGTSRKKTKRFP